MRTLRQRAGLTVEQLAVLAGISPETARRAETGRRAPSGRVVSALAAALRTTPADLAPVEGPLTLKQFRQRAGRTQREVAEMIGVSTQMVSRVEAGIYGVRHPERWAAAYQLTAKKWTAAWQTGRDQRKAAIIRAVGQ